MSVSPHRSAADWARRVTRRFVDDSGGAIAVIFALAIGAVFVLVGMGVDYARLTDSKAKLQGAADAAALASAAAARTTTAAERQKLAVGVVAANFSAAPTTVTESEPLDGSGAASYIVEASASVPLYFGGMLGVSTWTVTSRATAVATASTDTFEIALALDNTGSMASVIGDLRAAAGNFVNTAMTGPNVKVSVVPYVAAVNPGLTDMSMVDMNANGMWNGDALRSQWLTKGLGCVETWGASSGGGTTTTTTTTTTSTPVGSSESGDVGGSAIDMMEVLNPFRRFARAVFGVAEAHAQNVTTNTIAPVATTTVVSPTSGQTYQIPFDFQTPWKIAGVRDCDWLANPVVVSNYDLHQRIATSGGGMSRWKGCVEARPTANELTIQKNNFGWNAPNIDDFDVKDIPPDPADGNTLFVPYFWPDEPDYDPATDLYVAPGTFSSATGGYHNNYMPDGQMPASWNWDPVSHWASGFPILKYDGVTPAVIKESWPNTSGPNASCPDPVLRLTNVKATVSNKIANLGYWYNGGTVISEGVMWAWRTLSPKAPYADGRAYSVTGNHKVMVVMSDGVNGLATNGGASTSNISDYSAYGYLGARRLWYPNAVQSFTQLNTFLRDRTAAACTNAKASGIMIYTILFNHGLSAAQTTEAQDVLRSCATSPSNFFNATDASSLNAAFASISAGVGTLRLVK